MIKALLDLSYGRKNKDKILKNVVHLKVMLKDKSSHINHIHSFIADTIVLAMV